MMRIILDDMATPELIANHKIAIEEYQRGETINHEDIDWN